MPDVLESAPELYLALAIFAGGLVAGFAGFGLASAAGTILLHFEDPTSAVPLMMVCSVLAQLAGLLYLRKAIEWRTSMPFVVGGILGVPLAISVFHRIDAESFRMGFGAFLAMYAGYTLTQQLSLAFRIRRLVLASPQAALAIPVSRDRVLPKLNGVTQIMVGFSGGFVGGLTAMPGALVTVWCDLQNRTKSSQRGVVQPFILVMQLLALVLMAGNTDLISHGTFEKVCYSLPFLAAGTALGLFLFGKVDNSSFRTVVLFVILLSGSGLIIR